MPTVTPRVWAWNGGTCSGDMAGAGEMRARVLLQREYVLRIDDPEQTWHQLPRAVARAESTGSREDLERAVNYPEQ